MNEPLKPGDKVTLMLPDHVVMVEVHTSTKTGFSVVLSSRDSIRDGTSTGRTYNSPWSLDREGVDWLRGYHLADSEAVLACRSAQGLLKEQEPEKKPAKKPFKSPVLASGLPVLPPLALPPELPASLHDLLAKKLGHKK